ncbi:MULTISPECIES: hypothetical protein [Luteimonas]|uniref:hypothetical protein n=1 Tax=Luteimonas TaxID=83614 RepID=UPI0013040EC9|nr:MULTISPECIES: hypothetical protein [Luteimonas]
MLGSLYGSIQIKSWKPKPKPKPKPEARSQSQKAKAKAEAEAEAEAGPTSKWMTSATRC